MERNPSLSRKYSLHKSMIEKAAEIYNVHTYDVKLSRVQ